MRRLQGQVLVVTPEEACTCSTRSVLGTGSLMMFQGILAMSKVVAAGQRQ